MIVQLKKQLEDGQRCVDAMTEVERKYIQLETGVQGVSILYKLFKLYRFDPLRVLTHVGFFRQNGLMLLEAFCTW